MDTLPKEEKVQDIQKNASGEPQEEIEKAEATPQVAEEQVYREIFVVVFNS
mgnify:CR=1 FL=1